MADKVQNKKLKLEESINKLTKNLSRPKFIPNEQKTRIEDQVN